MVIPALVISLVVFLIAGAVLAGMKHEFAERARVRLEAELGAAFEDASASDARHGQATWRGFPLKVVFSEYEAHFAVTLPSAILPYADLVARFAEPALTEKMQAFRMVVDARNVVTGLLPSDGGASEAVGALKNRLETVAAVYALRAHVPGELLDQIERVRSTKEIDQILLAVSEYFPNAPETPELIERAMQREERSPGRVARRAKQWLATRPLV